MCTAAIKYLCTITKIWSEDLSNFQIFKKLVIVSFVLFERQHRHRHYQQHFRWVFWLMNRYPIHHRCWKFFFSWMSGLLCQIRLLHSHSRWEEIHCHQVMRISFLRSKFVLRLTQRSEKSIINHNERMKRWRKWRKIKRKGLNFADRFLNVSQVFEFTFSQTFQILSLSFNSFYLVFFFHFLLFFMIFSFVFQQPIGKNFYIKRENKVFREKKKTNFLKSNLVVVVVAAVEMIQLLF